MSSQPHIHTPAHDVAQLPEERPVLSTRPSALVRIVMKPMTRVLNPLIRLAAGKRHVGFAAQIHHRGRTSGKLYVTPASARLAGDNIVVPLTFGPHSDWCRNVIAAGGCTIRYKGIDYGAVHPEVVARTSAPSWVRSAFKRRERAMFPLIGVRYFLLLGNASA